MDKYEKNARPMPPEFKEFFDNIPKRLLPQQQIEQLQAQLAERDKTIEELKQLMEVNHLAFESGLVFNCCDARAKKFLEIDRLEAGAQAIIDATHKAYNDFDLSEYYKAKLFIAHMRNTAKELRQKAQELK